MLVDNGGWSAARCQMEEDGMLLVADVGNTNTVFGLYETGAERAAAAWRASTRRDRMPDEWFAILAPLAGAAGYALADVRHVVISSVVPSVTTWLSAMIRQRLGLEPILITGKLDLKLGVRIDNPSELGADRIVNSIAAVERYGCPVIVIDLGTATTFDVVAADGAYVGGAIAPGLVISLEALAGRTALLPSVALTLPTNAIGRNTVTQMQSGLVCGYLAMLEGMIDRIRGELGVTAPVVITGGYAEIFAGASSRITHFDRDLTLDGLRLAFERLSSSEASV